MRRNIDFIINSDFSEKLIFRFKPQESHCHSFDDKPPQNWSDVYKVYFSFEIFERDEYNKHRTVYREFCDECSVMHQISQMCKYIFEGKKQVSFTKNNKEYTLKLLNNEIRPLGDGTSWTIRKINNRVKYEISLYNWKNIGYRFYLTKKQLKEFAEYLEYCCEYMLENGEGI